MIIYKCSKCGNIVELINKGGGTLVCCGENMGLVTENTVDAAKEKHVPVIEKNNSGYLVKVGSVTHPMEEKHYIQWIALEIEGKVYRQNLIPGQNPEAQFCISSDSKDIKAYEYCNLHGLWSSKL